MSEKIKYFLLGFFLFCFTSVAFADLLKSQQVFVSNDKKVQLTQKCFSKGEGNLSCNYYAPAASGEEELILEGVQYDDSLKWVGNVARIHVGSCGSPCFIDAFIDAGYKADIYQNMIVLDENNLCIAYPDDDAVVFKKLFSGKPVKKLSYKEYPYLQGPAQLALIEATVATNGDMTFSFYATDLPDGGEGDVEITIENPCESSK